MKLNKGCNILAHFIIIILFMFCKDIFCQEALEYAINVNKSVTVEEHSCVVIPCSFVAGGKTPFSGSHGFWRDQQANVIAATCNCNNASIKSNFHITGNPNQGDCTLTITDAKKEDTGEYFFRFEGPVRYNYNKDFMKVNVTVTRSTNMKNNHTTSMHGHHCTFAPGFSIEVTTSVIVQEGSCITVPCSFTVPNRNSLKNFRGFWKSKNKTTISADCKCSDMYNKTNVHVTGDLDKGDCTLGIINAKKEDSGTYFFQLEEPFYYNYEVKSVTVIVTDPPKEPEVTIASSNDPPKEPEVTIASSNECNDRIFDLLIGIVSGLAIVISFMLVLKLIAKKYFKMNLCLFVPMEYDSAEELPSGDMKDDIHKEVYSSVQKPKPKTKTPKMDKKQHSNNIPSDQEEVHYSSIVFKKHPLGGSPMQPPTEYAEYAEIVK